MYLSFEFTVSEFEYISDKAHQIILFREKKKERKRIR